MIWFEQMCCCHLQRQRKKPQAGAERNRTGRAEGLSTACSAVGTPPWLCRGKRAAKALTVCSLHITRLHGCCTGSLGAVICEGEGKVGSAGSG